MAITCPLCRSDLTRIARRGLEAARRPSSTQSLERVSVQEQMEADEADRLPAYLRRLERARRLNEYTVMTISGRPYGDLPKICNQVPAAHLPKLNAYNALGAHIARSSHVTRAIPNATSLSGPIDAHCGCQGKRLLRARTSLPTGLAPPTERRVRVSGED